MSYNERSSATYGWDPGWFGASGFGHSLSEKVKEFQRRYALDADGLVGPVTFRRAFTERESKLNDHLRKDKNIIYNGQFFPIDWDKVVLWQEDSGLSVSKTCYTDYSGRKPRDISMFVNHWDVCLSSASCVKVLNQRNISVHFCIDNDGTIYQLMDMQHKAWHAGNSRVNGSSVGVEISNAYYTKYQSWYDRRFGPRPVVESAEVHGRKIGPFLGFYPEQIKALKALWRAVNEACGVPLAAPLKNGSLDTGVNQDVLRGSFSGIINHYNVSAKKIDCAGLDIQKLLG